MYLSNVKRKMNNVIFHVKYSKHCQNWRRNYSYRTFKESHSSGFFTPSKNRKKEKNKCLITHVREGNLSSECHRVVAIFVAIAKNIAWPPRPGRRYFKYSEAFRNAGFFFFSYCIFAYVVTLANRIYETPQFLHVPVQNFLIVKE